MPDYGRRAAFFLHLRFPVHCSQGHLPEGTAPLKPQFQFNLRSRICLFWMLSICAPMAAPRTPGAGPSVMQGGDPAGKDPAQIFREGKQALQNSQLTVAEDCFRRVIALDPKSTAAYIDLGVTYMREKRWNDALVPLRKAESLSPVEPGIQLNIGLAYYRKNDFAEAIGPFLAVLKATPDSLQAKFLLGLCYFFTDKYREATEALAPLWEKESTNLNYLYVLSIAASKSSNEALQQQSLDRMLAIGQDTAEFHLYVGKAWLAEEDSGKALKEFQAAAAAKPDLPMVHYFLGRAYLEQQAYPQAERELLQDVALEPGVSFNYEDLGTLYARLHQTERAERYYRLGLDRNNTLVNSWFGLAKLYRDSGRYREALEALDHAVALVPQSASLHYTRAQVLSRLGEKTKASEEFQRAASLLKQFNDRLQQDFSGDRSVDAQGAAEQ
jgi:tetratricopeptide (TPR) repeat protein